MFWKRINSCSPFFPSLRFSLSSSTPFLSLPSSKKTSSLSVLPFFNVYFISLRFGSSISIHILSFNLLIIASSFCLYFLLRTLRFPLCFYSNSLPFYFLYKLFILKFYFVTFSPISSSLHPLLILFFHK